MNQMLKIGRSILAETSGKNCKVKHFIGNGSQGEVYQANLAGNDVALKWYFPQWSTSEQKEIITTLVKKGPPSKNFLWPMELAVASDLKGFGYIMPLRGEQYKSITDLMMRRIDPSFKALATAGFELADSFLQLHSKGLSYRDISNNNVFIEPNTGEILICDNDNVTVDGMNKATVFGTPRFMAPEIVRGEAFPTTQTDLFSLSVLLFYIFMIHHPLEGKKELDIKCFDSPAMTKIYGTEPVFIFDPNNTSNRPVPGYHDNASTFWSIYPQFLRDLFTKALTVGIHDAENGRVRENEWRSSMVRLRDSIVYCSRCGSEAFYDIDSLKVTSGNSLSCWSCKKKISLPPRIRIGKRIAMLNHDTKLYFHHIDDQKMYDFSQAIAAVTQHPKSPGIWGLTNLSDEKWVVTCAEGIIKDVEPKRSVTLASNTKINFGKIEGELRT
jgi:serine/threonine protein kinase